MNALISYLLDNLMLDFSCELSLDQVREFLRHDKDKDSYAAALLDKLTKDRGTDDMMITLADCLKEYIREGIDENVMRDQLRVYSDS